MYTLTQGTIITGFRSQKYENIPCYGIVVSARCDLENCKASKIYCLIGMPVDDWLLSAQGFNEVLSQRAKSYEETLKAKVESAQLNWDALKTFSLEEFSTVVESPDNFLDKKLQSKLKKDFQDYKNCISNTLPFEERITTLKEQKSAVVNYLTGLSNGALAHYTYIPEDAYLNNACLDKGIIVDLQELEYISLDAAEILARGEMDVKCLYLKEKNREKYNEKFFLNEEPGYALAKWDVGSPWIEYLMQKFSNSFIRIGVNNPQKSHIQLAVDRICAIG